MRTRKRKVQAAQQKATIVAIDIESYEAGWPVGTMMVIAATRKGGKTVVKHFPL